MNNRVPLVAIEHRDSASGRRHVVTTGGRALANHRTRHASQWWCRHRGYVVARACHCPTLERRRRVSRKRSKAWAEPVVIRHVLAFDDSQAHTIVTRKGRRAIAQFETLDEALEFCSRSRLVVSRSCSCGRQSPRRKRRA
jgi:hypothetical protein